MTSELVREVESVSAAKRTIGRQPGDACYALEATMPMSFAIQALWLFRRLLSSAMTASASIPSPASSRPSASESYWLSSRWRSAHFISALAITVCACSGSLRIASMGSLSYSLVRAR